MRGQNLTDQDLAQAGFDSSLIDANLRLSPEERALRHQAALDLMLALSVCRDQLCDRAQPVAAPAGRR